MVATSLYWWLLVCTGGCWSVLVALIPASSLFGGGVTGVYWWLLVCTGGPEAWLFCVLTFGGYWFILVVTGLYWLFWQLSPNRGVFGGWVTGLNWRPLVYTGGAVSWVPHAVSFGTGLYWLLLVYTGGSGS